MNMLETVLRSAGAENYIKHFESNKLEAATLPLLTNKDLEIVGVDNDDVRKNILSKAATLQIPTEKNIDLNVTDEYVQLVLVQMLQQLQLHHASLSCAVKREDVVVCSIKTHNASKCLERCVVSLEKQLDEFENRFGNPERKRNRKWPSVWFAGAAAVVLLIAGRLAYGRVAHT